VLHALQLLPAVSTYQVEHMHPVGWALVWGGVCINMHGCCRSHCRSTHCQCVASLFCSVLCSLFATHHAELLGALCLCCMTLTCPSSMKQSSSGLLPAAASTSCCTHC
jgi:hypothetical protein